MQLPVIELGRPSARGYHGKPGIAMLNEIEKMLLGDLYEVHFGVTELSMNAISWATRRGVTLEGAVEAFAVWAASLSTQHAISSPSGHPRGLASRCTFAHTLNVPLLSRKTQIVTFRTF